MKGGWLVNEEDAVGVDWRMKRGNRQLRREDNVLRNFIMDTGGVTEIKWKKERVDEGK